MMRPSSTGAAGVSSNRTGITCSPVPNTAWPISGMTRLTTSPATPLINSGSTPSPFIIRKPSMFLDSLHEVNQLVQDQLASARIKVSYIEPHTEMLTPMDFVRPDYSTISIKVPAHRFDVAVGYYSECKTPSDCANRIVQFILDAANEFTKPRVHMSRAYLNYSPLADVDNRRAL